MQANPSPSTNLLSSGAVSCLQRTTGTIPIYQTLHLIKAKSRNFKLRFMHASMVSSHGTPLPETHTCTCAKLQQHLHMRKNNSTPTVSIQRDCDNSKNLLLKSYNLPGTVGRPRPVNSREVQVRNPKLSEGGAKPLVSPLGPPPHGTPVHYVFQF